MCWSCDNEKLGYAHDRSFSTYRPERVVQDFAFMGKRLKQLAYEQRMNLETIKLFKSLCDRHIANYETVVQALEAVNDVC